MTTLSFDQGTLVLSDLPDKRIPQGAWRRDGRINAWRREAMYYRSTLDTLGGEVEDRVPSPVKVRFPRTRLPPLDAAQTAALAAWAGCGTLVLPTAGLVLHAVRSLEVATLIAAPGIRGMYRWHRAVGAMLNHGAGLVGDAHFDVRPITVATYDAAGMHMTRMGAVFGLIVFDEAEHLVRGFRSDVARFSTARCRLGITSTVVQSPALAGKLERLIGPPAGLGYVPHDARQHKVSIPRKAVRRILEIHRDQRVLILTGSDDASIAVSRRFLVPALLGATDSRERSAVLKGFAEKTLPVIAAGWPHVAGSDLPLADAALLLAPGRDPAPVVDGGVVYGVEDRPC